MMSRTLYGNLIAYAVTAGSLQQAFSQDSPTSLLISPGETTIFPIFYGISGKVIIDKQYDLGISYGLAPKSYYTMIGNIAAEFGDNSAYDDVIEAAFQNNSIWMFEFRYNFEKSLSGFFVKASYLRLQSNGSANVDTVLHAITGQSYGLLKDALIATGRSPEIDLDAVAHIGEIAWGYSWQFADVVIVSASLGIGKIFASKIELKTGLPSFEATEAGSNLLRTGESKVEDIIEEYGLSPTIGVSVHLF